MDANILERIISFDEKDAASRVLPFKNLSDVVMAKHDNKRTCSRPSNATNNCRCIQTILQWKWGCKDHQESIWKLPPENIKIKRHACRLVCCCSYRVNMEHLCYKLKHLSANKNQAGNKKSSAELVETTVFDPSNTNCVVG